MTRRPAPKAPAETTGNERVPPPTGDGRGRLTGATDGAG